MSKNQTKDEFMAKLQRRRGYKGWRIEPYWRKPALFVLLSYTYLGHGNVYGWRALGDARGETRTFPTPEQAYEALLAWKKELADLDKLFDPE